MIRNFLQFVILFPRAYSIKLLLLLISSVLSGIFEILGITMIIPFITVVRNPEIVETAPILSDVYNLLNFENPKNMLYLLAAAMGAIFFFKNAYVIAHQYIEFGFIMRWKNFVVQKLMEQYIRRPYSFHLQQSSGKLMSTLSNEINHVFDNFILQFVIMISNIIIFISLLSLVLYMFFLPALITGCILIFLIVIQIFVIKKITAQVDQDYMLAKSINLSILQKAILAIKETKAFLKEKTFIDEYNQTNNRVSHHDRMVAFMRHFPTHITEMILITSIIVMTSFILADPYATQDNLTSLAILALVSFRIAPSINRTLYSYARIKSSQTSLKNIYAELSSKTDDKESIKEPRKLAFKSSIDLKNVNFTYDEKQKEIALYNINLSIKKGEFIGIIGASGSGKTTLANILMGLLFPQSGALLVDQKIITKNNIRSYRKNISYVAQDPFLFNGSVKQNVAFGIKDKNINTKKVISSLKKSQLYDFFMSKKGKLDFPLGENGKNLSGGQKQRLAIARALYNDPTILILDEATSALDVETEKKISDSINDLKGKKTIVAIAHRLSTLKKCDRIIFMKSGTIFAQGTFSSLCKKHKEFRKIIALSNVQQNRKPETI